MHAVDTLFDAKTQQLRKSGYLPAQFALHGTKAPRLDGDAGKLANGNVHMQPRDVVVRLARLARAAAGRTHLGASCRRVQRCATKRQQGQARRLQTERPLRKAPLSGWRWRVRPTCGREEELLSCPAVRQELERLEQQLSWPSAPGTRRPCLRGGLRDGEWCAKPARRPIEAGGRARHIALDAARGRAPKACGGHASPIPLGARRARRSGERDHGPVFGNVTWRRRRMRPPARPRRARISSMTTSSRRRRSRWTPRFRSRSRPTKRWVLCRQYQTKRAPRRTTCSPRGCCSCTSTSRRG